jgi:site-specific recombinase XerD
MGAQEIERFLSHLATNNNVAVATQKQSFNALFFYRDVLLILLDESFAPIRFKRKLHLPTVCTEDEIESIFKQMQGTHPLMARLIYASGIRLMEYNSTSHP